MISESQLITWTRPLSTSEDDRCKNTVERITRTLRGKFGFQVDIFLQGSYKNNTNVRFESDVDIVVRHNDYYFSDTHFLSKSAEELFWKSFEKSSYTFFDFKKEVYETLLEEFGSEFVERSEKCIRVKKNSYRVSADVVPCFVHKRFSSLTTSSAEGIEFICGQSLKHIISFPEQHYINGLAKHNGTNRKYRKHVRVMKYMNDEMIKQGLVTSEEVTSFFLECLIWNIKPNFLFEQANYKTSLKNILAKIWTDMQNNELAMEYAEVSDLLWLFKGSPERSPLKTKKYIDKVWNFVGY